MSNRCYILLHVVFHPHTAVMQGAFDMEMFMSSPNVKDDQDLDFVFRLPDNNRACFRGAAAVVPHPAPGSVWSVPASRLALLTPINNSGHLLRIPLRVSSGPLPTSTLPLNTNFPSSVQGCPCEGCAHVRCSPVNPCKHWVYLSP